MFFCLVFSHSQLQELKRIAQSNDHGIRGRSRTQLDNALSLRHVAEFQLAGLTFNAAINAEARADMASPNTIRAAAQTFLTTNTLPTLSTENRGRGNPSHPLNPLNTEEYGPSLQAEILIHSLIHRQKSEGLSINSTTITADLKTQLNIEVTPRTVRRWLHALGYSWQHKRYVGGMKPQAKNVRIRQFIVELAAALSKEAQGDVIIIYTDESYIHTHHATKKGWFPTKDRDVMGDSNGTRLILLHAMTDDGLLSTPDAISTNWLAEEALTAEIVFEDVLEDDQDEGDYHNTMNSAKYIAFVRNRLIPTIAKIYPGKKAYIVLDNASYHKPRDESWVSNTRSQSKHDLVHKLLDLGVTELTTVNAPHHVIPAHKFEALASAGGPSKDDLLAAVDKWLAEHPDHNRTVVEKLLHDAGHSVIYTPPFCPEVQPIELLWAQVKQQVASKATHNRSIVAAREQVEEAFESFSKLDFNNMVKHTHDWIDEFLQTDAAEDLAQCGTLAGVMKHLPLLKIANEPITDVPIPPSASAAAAASSSSSSVPASSSSASARTLRRRTI